MGPKVVHWEVTDKDGAALQKYYGAGNPEDGLTGGIDSTSDGSPGMTTFSVGVEDVAGYIEKASSLGGSVIMPETQVMAQVIIGLFADPEGRAVGLAKSLPQ
jgi:predicted enzyme related to lactoylglutathione lyase